MEELEFLQAIKDASQYRGQMVFSRHAWLTRREWVLDCLRSYSIATKKDAVLYEAEYGVPHYSVITGESICGKEYTIRDLSSLVNRYSPRVVVEQLYANVNKKK